MVSPKRGFASASIGNHTDERWADAKTAIFSPEPSLRMITDVAAFRREHLPKWNR